MSNGSWNYQVFWDEAKNRLQQDLPEQEFTMWFNRIEYSRSERGVVFLRAPSSFYRDQVIHRYLDQIESILKSLSGDDITVKFEINESVQPTPVSRAPAFEKAHYSTGNEELPRRPDPKPTPERRPHPHLNQKLNFDSFIIGPTNQFAANAAISVARNPGTGYNPFLIYGNVGLGKTHLIQAIGNAIHHDFPDKKVVYVTMESFMNDFFLAIREKRTTEFKNRYRTTSVLLIDDIHFLQNKPETQEELFHTFNALYDRENQMVFTCDRPVSEIKNLTDRLRNRFERGLNVDLQPPTYETRYAILRKKSESATYQVPDDVIHLICEKITSNVRDLEKALTKLIAFADLVSKEITLDIAQNQLKDFFASPQQNNISIDLIQKVVAQYFGLSQQDLKGKKKTKVVVFPRQVGMYIARQITEFSTTEIGSEFGGRDHTTVMHSCQRIEDRKKVDATMVHTIEKLVNDVKSMGTKSL